MTQIISHDFNSSEGALVRVSITSTTMTVSQYYKNYRNTSSLSRQYEYELKANSNGDKYLVLKNKEPDVFWIKNELTTGVAVDWQDNTLQMVKFFQHQKTRMLGYEIKGLEGLPESFYSLLTQTICGWFDHPLDANLGALGPQIFFPALKGCSSKRSAWLLELIEFQETFPEVIIALRENSDWISFLKAISAEGMVVTDGDLSRLVRNPQRLRIAAMKLGRTVNEIDALMVRDFSDTFFAYRANEMCIRFMLRYLPEEQRLEATELLFNIASRYTVLKNNVSMNRALGLEDDEEDWDDEEDELDWRCYEELSEDEDDEDCEDEEEREDYFMLNGPLPPEQKAPLHLIPRPARPSLAKSLLEALHRVEHQIAEVEKRKDPSTLNIYSGFFQTIYFWLIEFSAPTMQNNHTKQDMVNHFEKYFGSAFSSQISSIEPIDSRVGLIWPIADRDIYQSIDGDMYQPPIIKLLEYSTNNSIKNSRSNVVAAICDEGYYITNDNSFARLDYFECREGYYSSNDMMKLIQEGARKIDKKLFKLEREATPENRSAYLLLNHKERDLAKTWYYYDLGITDPRKIIALKLAKVKDERQIVEYSQLPNDLFDEIISLLGNYILLDSMFFGNIRLDKTISLVEGTYQPVWMDWDQAREDNRRRDGQSETLFD